MENFHAAMYQANLLYGIDINPDDFEELGLIAWNFIGNHRCKLYRYCATVNCSDNTIQLPCNCSLIESVTYDFEDWNYTSNSLPEGDLSSGFTENYIDSRKHFENPLYEGGRYVKYERVGDTLYLDDKYNGRITILYKGDVLDEDGLPELTQKEVDAIAVYVAYVTRYKKALVKNNANDLQAAQLLKAEWLQKCDAARVSEYLSQNDMNEILDAKTNWNRKIFNKSYKPVK